MVTYSHNSVGIASLNKFYWFYFRAVRRMYNILKSIEFNLHRVKLFKIHRFINAIHYNGNTTQNFVRYTVDLVHVSVVLTHSRGVSRAKIAILFVGAITGAIIITKRRGTTSIG